MADVRGKFKVTEITKNHCNPEAARVTLDAVYSQNPEDQSYSAATPSAKIEMSVSNPSAVEKLALGKSFYVDFTAVEET
jgi:hypothetical protein